MKQDKMVLITNTVWFCPKDMELRLILQLQGRGLTWSAYFTTN